jgi:xylulokinase
VLDELLIDRRLYIDYHLIPNKYLLNGCMASSGNILRWFRDQFAPGETYANLDQAAIAVPPTSQGLIMLPYFLGEKTPLHDPHARGVFMGLTLSHTRAHLYRAVMEGISFGFLHHLEILRSLGLTVTRSRVTNGGSSNFLWPQITSDVLGLPLEHIAEHPGSSLGAAFVAGIGAGVFKGWGEIERFIVVDKLTIPEARNTAAYQHHYRVYRKLYQVNRPIFGLISGEEA